MTLAEATFDIETESAGRYVDATEADLHRLVHLMEDKNSYLIVERGDGSDGFAQAIINRRRDGARSGYIVEYRDPGEVHQQAKVKSAAEVHEILAGWALSRPGWRELARWKPRGGGFIIDDLSSCDFVEIPGGWRVVFRPFAITGEGETRHKAYVAMWEQLQSTPERRARLSTWAKDHIVPTHALPAYKKQRLETLHDLSE